MLPFMHHYHGSNNTSRPTDGPPLPAGPPPERSRERITDRVGTWVVALVSVSLIFLTASLIFLSWIWFGSREDERWRQLILGPNSDLAITLTSVAVRASVATISWVAASMMACVVVERYGVVPDKVAQASAARYTGALVSLMFGGYAMRRWFKVMIPLQFACAIASQFTSTLLFSDIDTIPLPGFSQGMDMKYDFDPFDANEPRSPLLTAQSNYASEWSSYEPLAFETFAEHAEPESRILDDAVDDTGPVWRAFLPIENESVRASVREYTGIARVFDARTICIRPDIQSLNYTFSGQTGLSLGQWMGSAVLNTSQIPNLFDPENVVPEIYFSCEQHDRDEDRATGHQWVQCHADSDFLVSRTHKPLRVGTLEPLYYNMSAIESLDAEEERYVEDQDLGFEVDEAGGVQTPRTRVQERRTGDGYMLMDLGPISARKTFAPPANKTSAVVVPLSLQSSVGNGPWHEIQGKFPANTTRTPDASWSFRGTYCMDVAMPSAAPVEYLNITATGTGGSKEPASSWHQDKARYATEEVRRQLGATNETLTASERGILTISKASLDRAIEDEIKPANMSFGVMRADDYVGIPRPLYTKHGFTKSLASYFQFPNDPQPFWDDFFAEAIEETGSPALAVQALNTAVSRMLYTRWLPSFTRSERVEVVLLAPARAPVRAAGYALVVTVLFVQIVLLAIATAMFRACSSSRLDCVWMTTAQVAASPEVGDVLSRAGMMTDTEVTRHVRGEKKAWFKRRDKVGRLAVRDGLFQPVDEDGIGRAGGIWQEYDKMSRRWKILVRAVSSSSGDEV